MGTFDGKVVIVTGGAYGIGRDTAYEFAREGARVVVADIDVVAGKAVEARLEELGPGGLLVEADAFSPGRDLQPFAANLLENIERLGLCVDRIVPIHGPVVTFDDLVANVRGTTD